MYLNPALWTRLVPGCHKRFAGRGRATLRLGLDLVGLGLVSPRLRALGMDALLGVGYLSAHGAASLCGLRSKERFRLLLAHRIL
jgi:hypothetical protein